MPDLDNSDEAQRSKREKSKCGQYQSLLLPQLPAQTNCLSSPESKNNSLSRSSNMFDHLPNI
ncbi:hypothetical protein X975_18062, partial [Stegodyphus mimosarum]